VNVPSSLKLRLSQLVLLAVFCSMALAVSLTAPFNAGPDEVAHFQATRFMAKTGRLPVSLTERAEAGYKSDLPPLFYLAVGYLGRGLDLDSPPFVKIAQDNPRLQLVVGHENIISWRALTTEDPYRGEVLLWTIGRWFTLLSGLAGLVLTYVLMLSVYPGQPWLALSGTALLGLLPVYLKTSGVISYEPLLGATVTLYILALHHALQHPVRPWRYVVVGFLLGTACLVKYTPWPLMPGLVLMIAGFGLAQKWPGRSLVASIGLAMAGLLLALGPWVAFSLLHFNQIAERGWLQGVIYPFLATDGSDTTSLRFASLLSGGALGSSNPAANDLFLSWLWRMVDWGFGPLSWVLIGLAAAAGMGLARAWRDLGLWQRWWVGILLGHGLLLASLPLARFWLTGAEVTGMAQHIAFPAGAIVLVLVVQGLQAWVKPKAVLAVLLAVTALGLVRSSLSVAGSIEAPWPVRTVPYREPERVLANFEGVSLLDYQLEVADHQLAVTLFWRAEELLAEDFLVELSLFDPSGQPVARWTGQPLNGRYPTRAWLPGDRLRDQIKLPLVGLAAGEYYLQVRLLNGEVAVASSGGEKISLGQVTLAGAERVAASESDGGGGPGTLSLDDLNFVYTLWSEEKRELPIYGENATLVVSLQPPPPADFRLLLLGPEGREIEPFDQLGQVYNFRILPGYASGDYRLRLKIRVPDQAVKQADTPPLLRAETERREFALGSEALTQPLAANFANYVNLLGYHLPQDQVQPGQALPLTLFWQARRTIGADLIMVNRLIDDQGQVWGGRDRKAREVYSTMLWAPGEIVSDPFAIQVSPETPPGNYTIFVGLYLPVGEAPVSLPLVQEGQLSQATSVKIGPVWVAPAAESAAREVDP
jgi:hypothetical protein